MSGASCPSPRLRNKRCDTPTSGPWVTQTKGFFENIPFPEVPWMPFETPSNELRLLTPSVSSPGSWVRDLHVSVTELRDEERETRCTGNRSLKGETEVKGKKKKTLS